MRCRARQVFGGNGKRVLACMLEDLSAFASVAETGIHHQPAQLFAESEVITLINEGVELPDIAAGIHEATAGRLHALGEKGGGVLGARIFRTFPTGIESDDASLNTKKAIAANHFGYIVK